MINCLELLCFCPSINVEIKEAVVVFSISWAWHYTIGRIGVSPSTKLWTDIQPGIIIPIVLYSFVAVI